MATIQQTHSHEMRLLNSHEMRLLMINATTAQLVVEAQTENFSATTLLAIAHSRLEATEFKVYFGLVQNLDYSNSVKATIDKLLQICYLKSRTTLIRALNSLVSMGMVRRNGNKQNGYSYQLTMPDDWVERGIKTVLTKVKSFADKVFKKVQKRDDVKSGLPEQAEEVISPIGDITSSATVPPIQSRNETTTEVPNLDCENSVLLITAIENKIQAARERGWYDTEFWIDWKNEAWVGVNRNIVPVAEFLARTLDSFEKIVLPPPLPQCCKEMKERLIAGKKNKLL